MTTTMDPEQPAASAASTRTPPPQATDLPLRNAPKTIPELQLEGSRIQDPHPSVPTTTVPRVAIAVDPVALITTECITVTSAMRKHARWAQSSVSAILGGPSSSYRPNAGAAGPSRVTKSGSIKRRPGSGSMSGEKVEQEPEDTSLASRWGLRASKTAGVVKDNPLMSAFARLRAELRGCTDITTFDIPSLLRPFLQVIRSSSTSAPITSLALVAITKFFAYNLIRRDSPRLSLGMQLLSAAITHCRFEASDSAADEIVLLRILKLMEGMLSGPGGDLLSDESICEMMETGLSMCCQMRLSEVLRRSAEMSMITMCQVIFERLKNLELQAGGDVAVLEESMEGAEGSDLKMDAPLTGNNAASQQDSAKMPQTPVTPTNGMPEKKENGGESRTSMAQDTRPSQDSTVRPSVNGSTTDLTSATGEEELVIKPYSLPSIRELFRVLVNLLNPHDRQHTDAMRIMALRIIDVSMEVAGPSIARHPSLASLAKDDLCRNLFQLVRSDNMNLLNESLRVAGTLLATCRSVLKLQQELFLSYLVACLHPRVPIPSDAGIDPSLYEGVPQNPKLVKQPPSSASSGRSTPVPVKDRQKLGMEGGMRKPDAREAMVESVGSLARIPSFFAELFVNYDCEVDRSDLCEDLVGLLSRNAFPDAATWSTTNVPPLCLDALLGYVQFIADRLEDEPITKGYPDRDTLREQRTRKKIIIKGVNKFNEHPKAGIAYLASQGIIENPDDPVQLVKFLKSSSRVSKKTLGDFLSKRGNEAMLSAFMDCLDFEGKRVDEALRELLGAFRLPGESPLIERIVSTFSEKYSAFAPPADVANKDAVFVLTYGIIMLNTDQHNPNMKQKRMSNEDFAKNLRGTNGGKDFSPDYLRSIFEEIKTNEIILPDEHDNKHAFDHAWKELLSKAQTAGDLIVCDTNIYDADMFEATWKPVLATLSYVFMSASEDTVYQRVIAGFEQCAQIAAKYGLTEVMDRIVYSLSTISTLGITTTNTALNTEVQVKDKSVMVSELAVKFGRDYRAQLATVVLFRGVVAGNEAFIKESWDHIIRIWLNLFMNSLIPSTFSASTSVFEIPPIPIQSPNQIIKRGEQPADSGLFSSFTSYLAGYAADDPPEPSDQELADTLATVDCLNACPMEEIFANVMSLHPEAMVGLVDALLEHLPQNGSPVVAVVKGEPGTPAQKSNNNRGPPKSTYNPTVVYLLEFASMLAVRDVETAAIVGKDVVEALQDVIRDASHLHPIIISRAVYYLLNLLNACHDNDFIRAPVILHTVSMLVQTTAGTSALPILKGLGICLRSSRPLKSEIVNTGDYWDTLQGLHAMPDAAPLVFEQLVGILEDKPSSITADNYERAVLLLNDFATSGSVGAMIEQKREKNVRRSKGGKAHPSLDNEVVKRGAMAVTFIYQLSSRVPDLIQKSHLERNEAWTTYWSPIFLALSKQCINPCREIRHQAFTGLQRALLSPELASPDHQEWTAIFGEVLFPLIIQLLKPEVYHTDPHGMSETRVQAATLLCRIFLHYLVLLSEWKGMLELWLKILDIMDRLMNSGQSDSLEEAVPESLKNILLVMANSGFLVPPEEDPKHSQLWEETWKRLERFLPRMYKDIYPEVKEEEKKKNAPVASPQPPQPSVESAPEES